MFFGPFEPVVAHFGPWKIPKCLENEPFQDQMGQKWVKNTFFKTDLAPFGMLKQVVLAHFEPEVTRFGPWKIPKCLEHWPFWGQKWVKNGSKTHFTKIDPGPLGMLKQMFLAHFEPVVTCLAHGKCQSALKMGHFGTKNGSKMGEKRAFPKVIQDHWGCSNKSNAI